VEGTRQKKVQNKRWNDAADLPQNGWCQHDWSEQRSSVTKRQHAGRGRTSKTRETKRIKSGNVVCVSESGVMCRQPLSKATPSPAAQLHRAITRITHAPVEVRHPGSFPRSLKTTAAFCYSEGENWKLKTQGWHYLKGQNVKWRK